MLSSLKYTLVLAGPHVVLFGIILQVSPMEIFYPGNGFLGMVFSTMEHVWMQYINVKIFSVDSCCFMNTVWILLLALLTSYYFSYLKDVILAAQCSQHGVDMLNEMIFCFFG